MAAIKSAPAALLGLLAFFHCLAAGAPSGSSSWCLDHPLFPPLAGYRCGDYEEQKLGAAVFPTSRYGGGLIVEGRSIRIKYYPEPGADPTGADAALGHYTAIVKKLSGALVWRQDEETPTVAVFSVPRPGMTIWVKVTAGFGEIELRIVEKTQ